MRSFLLTTHLTYVSARIVSETREGRLIKGLKWVSARKTEKGYVQKMPWDED